MGDGPAAIRRRLLGGHKTDQNDSSASAWRAARAKVKATFQAAFGPDRLEGVAGTSSDAATGGAFRTAAKSKLTANPFAPSPDALKGVQNDVHADVVLPPPAAHIRPATPAQQRVFLQRIVMRSAPGAVMGAAAAAVGTPEVTPDNVRAIITHGTPESLTPDESAYVKALVGKTPPAQPFTTAPEDPYTKDSPIALDPTSTGAKLTDSDAALKAAATTYVPWQQFFVTLTKKQQANLAVWMLQRQKLQMLAASISIGMLEADKQLQINNIAMERVESMLGLLRAVEQSKNSATVGAMRPLKNAGLSVMRSGADIKSGENQNNDLAPAQDLHRMAFLRKALSGDADSAGIFNHYAQQVGVTNNVYKEETPSLSVPNTQHGDNGPPIAIHRSLLSDDEVANLKGAAKEQYKQSIAEMDKQRSSDYPSMVGLYNHEAALCRGASAHYRTMADNLTPGSQAHTDALGHAEVWDKRAANLQSQGEIWQDRLQHRAAWVMHDENRYGDMLRERSALTHKRKEIDGQLTSTSNPPDANQREHLERVRMNIDWRAISLDRELGRHTNPKMDNRLDRWHTGAKNIADGFFLAHRDQQDANHPHPNLRHDTMTALAPVGAAALNAAYIRAVEALSSGRNTVTLTAADFAGLELKVIDQKQMANHLSDRRAALRRYQHEDKDQSTPQKAALAQFHEAERKQIDAVEYFFKSQKVLSKATTGNMLGLPISGRLPSFLTPRGAKRAPVTFKDETPELHRSTLRDGAPQDIALDPAKAGEYYGQLAAAGASVMASGGDPRAAGYQNKLFEALNRVSDAALFINFDAIERAATETAMGNTQDIIGEACQKFSEVFSEFAQERRSIEASIVRILDEAFKVPN